jgi:hypothetical protein
LKYRILRKQFTQKFHYMHPTHSHCFRTEYIQTKGVRWVTTAGPGYGWRTVRPPTHSRGLIFPGLHIWSHSTGSIKHDRQKYTASNIWACALCAVSPVVLSSVLGGCYRDTCEISWQYNLYKETDKTGQATKNITILKVICYCLQISNLWMMTFNYFQQNTDKWQ